MNFSTGGGSTPYQAVPQGRYLGRIIAVAYVGTIYNKFQQKDEPSLQVGFELNHKSATGKNSILYRPYKASMHAQASLRKLIEVVESRTLSNAEALAFDVTSLAGRNVWINVENTYSPQPDGTTRVGDKITSIFPALESLASTANILRWDVRKDDISLLPQRLQKIAMTSVEWRSKHGNVFATQHAFGQAMHVTQPPMQQPVPQQPVNQQPPWVQPTFPSQPPVQPQQPVQQPVQQPPVNGVDTSNWSF